MDDKDQQGQASSGGSQPAEQPTQIDFIDINTSDNSRLNKGEDNQPLSTKDVKK